MGLRKTKAHARFPSNAIDGSFLGGALYIYLPPFESRVGTQEASLHARSSGRRGDASTTRHSSDTGWLELSLTARIQVDRRSGRAAIAALRGTLENAVAAACPLRIGLSSYFADTTLARI